MGGAPSWRGQAADAFTDRLGQLPRDLHRASDSYGRVGTALGSYAAALRDGQVEARRLEEQAAHHWYCRLRSWRTRRIKQNNDLWTSGEEIVTRSVLAVEAIHQLPSRPTIFLTGELTGGPLTVGEAVTIQTPGRPAVSAQIRGIEFHSGPGQTTIAVDGSVREFVVPGSSLVCGTLAGE